MRVSLNFAVLKLVLCWTKEEVPTHFSKVGGISGCVKKLCILQITRNDLQMLSGASHGAGTLAWVTYAYQTPRRKHTRARAAIGLGKFRWKSQPGR